MAAPSVTEYSISNRRRADPVGRRLSAVAIVILLAGGCSDTPADPEGTLDRVRGGTIRVGATEHDPWVTLQAGEPSGIEVELVERLAEELDADLEWQTGSETELIEALELGDLDLVIGGLAADSVWSKHAALTHPYHTSRVVVAVPRAEEPPDDIAGIEVSVEAMTAAAGVLAKTDAVVRLVDDIATAQSAVAVEDWLLEDLDLQATDLTLIETDHVMALRLGENGWMTTVERFLLERPDEVAALLDEVTP